MQAIEDQLKEFPVQHTIEVQWGEMDAANHVNNVMYLRWAESARIHYFSKTMIGSDFQNGVGAILAWQDCKYIFPVRFPDTVLIGVKVNEILDDRLIMQTNLYSKTHRRIVAISKQQIMAYDYKNLKKVMIPDDWRNSILALESKNV